MSDQAFRKQIFILWLQGEEHAPPLVRRAIESWRYYNETWQIKVLNASEAERLLTPSELSISQKMSMAAKSDLIRTAILARHGGVWVDATCVCRTPLEAWLPDVLSAGFFAFDQPGPDRPIASWFLASTSGHIIPKTLLSAMTDVWAAPHVVGVDPPELSQRHIQTDRGTDYPWLSSDFWQKETRMPYFWMHYLFGYLLNNNQTFRTAWRNIPKMTAHIPQALSRRGLLKPGIETDTIRAAIKSLPAPVVKLNWRKHDLGKIPGLDALFQDT